jgi:competence CoiA-like predicted nuclease
MMICPVCGGEGTLRRGAQVREQRHFAVCMRCRSYVAAPAHEYFQLYSRKPLPVHVSAQQKEPVTA